MVLNSTLKSVLDTATGVVWYALEKPIEKPIPAGVYRLISEPQVISHSGDTLNRRARVQLTCIAGTVAALISLVENVRDGLNANTTDWQVSLPLETRLESKEDGILYSILEYYIRYNSD